MDLPVMPPVKPMLAKSVPEIPDLGHVEPKWDGFRTIVFRDGDDVILGSRNERPMTRYFPELVEAIKANTPPRCVIDGEIVTIVGERLDFETLQLRIHPAASRVTLLSEQTPASFIGFDLLAIGDEDLTARPFAERRARLVEALSAARAPVYCTPATSDLVTAREWFGMFEGAGLDGVVAKPLDGPYLPDKRAMFKIKHARTADCVIAGFRWHKSGPIVGSLLLGLYREEGSLQHARNWWMNWSSTGCRTRSCRSIRGAAGPRPRLISTTGCPATSAAGTPRRTCRSCRCGPSSSSRSPTTRWRGTGSVTPLSSAAGAPTANPAAAATTSWNAR
jgi:ATP-dependent DNA ligase